MKGQITLWDYYMDNFSRAAQMRREGFTNAFDEMPDHECIVLVEDHNGNRFKQKVVNSFGRMAFYGRSKGYDICWWKEVKG